MIDYRVLEKFNTTQQRMREVFTAEPSADLTIARKGETKAEKEKRLAAARQLSRDIDIREKWRRKIESRVFEGVNFSLKNWRLYSAVDLAWDSTPITQMTVPLLLHAQGKLKSEDTVTQLRKLSGGEAFIKTDKNGKPYVDAPKFVETSFNLVRSVITRRHAAQKVKYGQLWPYYKYESRSTGLPAKCRADVLSQRVDIMVDQFGLRHHDDQVMLDGFLYGRSFDFVRSRWEVEKQYRMREDGEVEEYISREGAAFINPHPSRTAWDNNYPPATINTDSGCEWLLFWDVIKWGDVEDNPDFYNKHKVGWSSRYWSNNGVFSSYSDYFTQHAYTIIPPQSGEQDISLANDRKANVGIYSSSTRDASTLVTNYFERFIPKDWGIGDYPCPVWGRFVVSSDSTVVFAEILPSTPAAFLGIGVNDSRQVSVSMAMDLFQYQDQMTNLLTHLLLVCQVELMRIIGLNTDLLEKENLEQIRGRLKGRDWWCDPIILEYSASKLEALGIKTDKAIEIAQAQGGGNINDIFTAMIRLVEMVEKLMALSPAEQGQPAPREISATEVNEIASTTSSLYSSISEDIDEFRAAKKRIIYESLVACSKGQVECPVKDRYTEKTIVAAGFTPKKGEDEDYVALTTAGAPRRRTVVGSVRALVHDYIFTTRDGAERPVNTQAANTLVQLISQILAVPMVAMAIGKEKLYELFNEVFRLSGAGVDLLLSLKEGEDDSLGQNDLEMMKQTLDELTGYIQKMAQQVQQTAQGLAEQEKVNADQEEALALVTKLAKQVQDIAKQVGADEGGEDGDKPQIPYQHAPDTVKRQMEAQAGYEPGFGEGDDSTPSKKKAQTTK